ncbi:MAG: phosphatase PAP2 family protein [Bacteroidetes bacterium]|nr:phosphatase PAP2 family protein [Bacteroidota bacterium]
MKRFRPALIVSAFLFVIYPVDAQPTGLRTLLDQQRFQVFEKGDFFDSGRSISQSSALNTFYGVDKTLFFAVFNSNGPAMTTWMSTSDLVAYPIMFGTPVAALILMGVRGDDYHNALELSGSWAGAVGSSMLLKHLVKRVRPFAALKGVVAKTGYAGAKGLSSDASMPSGHATIAFALATSLSVQHPQWYVVLPSALIASSIATSRVWLGVHYPSDVAMGAVLGVTSAVMVHFLIQ